MALTLLAKPKEDHRHFSLHADFTGQLADVEKMTVCWGTLVAQVLQVCSLAADIQK